MRIALFPDDYLPNSTLVHAKMFHELALELIRLGHTPIIITPGNPEQSTLLSVDFLDSVEIWRFKNGQTRGIGKVKRAINESLLSFNAWRAINKKVKDNPIDACINYAPTIFFGPLLQWFRYKYKTNNYLVLRDMFPQWAIDEGLISPRSPITLYFRLFEKLNYSSSDIIGLMSDANVNFFIKQHPKYKQIEILRNWACVEPFESEKISRSIRDELNIKGKVIYFYGGNIGHAQDMDNLLRLAKAMINETDAYFLFVGQGDEIELVKRRQIEWNLTNLTLLPSVSQTVYKELLLQVDVGLFSLAHSHKAHNFPGKLLGYMVQSLPILGSVNPGNDLIKYINDRDAGYAYINGEDESLLLAAKRLLNDEKLRKSYGCNAYDVLIKDFSVNAAAEKILQQINKEF
ncbi:glycosyltransferase WbuB [Photobacterium phosphoreum]|uniref:glycosyltransferase family 4 protein n=1 Tax=Photobacterium phosphoreum TaxID=659 RepID=UPI000D1596DA|nr:glycosyltransferase family 4 protein [Photobacterium phosphoreum]PSU64867.1 glycosyltransferase WbuB [Photobacterium phosphoreum]PSW06407.1 glycosyltransferase WbuB [Photobacterium phosphoreum]